VLRSIRSRFLALVIATVVPFTVLIGAGIWIRWWSDQSTAITQAISEARMLAAQIDDHIGGLDSLLTGLSEAVSTNPLDTPANDALLGKVKRGLPDFDAYLSVFSLEGNNIGMSGDPAKGRPVASRYPFIGQVLADRGLVIGDPLKGGRSGRWILSVARPIKDADGRVRAVLAAGTVLDHFQDVMQTRHLPEGTIVTVVNRKGIVIARKSDATSPVGGTWPSTLQKRKAAMSGSGARPQRASA
jgi:hypothetical protein